jgi:hypothetical protein
MKILKVSLDAYLMQKCLSAKGEKARLQYSGVRVEYKRSTVEYSGVRVEYSGVQRITVEYEWSTSGVQAEYRRSTVEYKRST